MGFLEKTGKNVDEALEQALNELKTTRDKVNIEVVEEAKSGLFGLFSKKAKIRVTLKEAAEILGLSTRRVVGLCNDGMLAGALQKGRGWKIPEETVYAYLGIVKPEKRNKGILSCAVGNTSYMDVVKNSYYVDKTLLIRDLIDDQVPVILFTRPRRFGKTLALDMLKTFFENIPQYIDH